MILSLLLFQAATGPVTKADAWIREQMTARKIPGMAVAVLQDGRPVLNKGFGLASVELKVPVTTETRFPIASVTKIFTATAVMDLVEQGRLTLDTPARAILPELPEAWQGATVRQLLSHTSGLPDIVESPNTAKMVSTNEDSAFAIVATRPLDFAPGAKWSYNQTNYALLGRIIRKLTGKPFPEVYAERFFGPLGMKSAVFGDARAVVPGRTTSYTRLKMLPNGVEPIDSLRTVQYVYEPFLHTAAGLNLNAGDLARFVEAVRTGRVLKAATRDTMWTAVRLADGTVPRQLGTVGFGLGWMVDDAPTGKMAGMEGGAAAAVRVYPSRGLVVAVLTNLQGAGPSELADGIARFFGTGSSQR